MSQLRKAAEAVLDAFISGKSRRAMAPAMEELNAALRNTSAPKHELDALGLREFVSKTLANAGVTDIETLSRMTDMDLLRIPGLGRQKLREIREMLRWHEEKNGSVTQ